MKKDGSPLHPNAKKLSTVWRKFATAAAVVTTLASTGSISHNDTVKAPTDPSGRRIEEVMQGSPVAEPDRPHAVHRSSGTYEMHGLREFGRRLRITLALIDDAKANYAAVSAYARNDYSVELDGIANRLTGQLQGGQMHDRAVLLDPARFDVGIALGMTGQDAVAQLLAAQGVAADPDTLKVAAAKMQAKFFIRMWPDTYTQEPSAFFNLFLDPEGKTCVIVPSSSHIIPHDIAGLTFDQRLSMINDHESWHCLDTRYVMPGVTAKQTERTFNSAEEMAADPVMMLYMATMAKKEAFADLGAAGERIRRDGMDISVIDKAIDWRKSHPSDNLHIYSAAILAALKVKIEEMGVDKYRAMTQEQVKELYYGVVDANALSPANMAFLVRLDNLEGDALKNLQAANGGNPDYLRAAAFWKEYVDVDVDTPATKPLTAAEQAFFASGREWNAPQRLQDKAFELQGRITPRGMIEAYGVLQTELLEKQKLDPDNQIYALYMARLQLSFTRDLRNLDYVQINRDRGVELVATEPLLADFGPRGRFPEVAARGSALLPTAAP